jgi:quercetin dioxygenase-like cupin family protein
VDYQELEKSETFVVLDIIEYVPHSVVIRTILKKNTGNITLFSFDSGEILTERNSPFDTFLQVMEGTAEVVINEESHLLKTGQIMIIPAHGRTVIKAPMKFKMISTVIKSGYEEVTI